MSEGAQEQLFQARIIFLYMCVIIYKLAVRSSLVSLSRIA